MKFLLRSGWGESLSIGRRLEDEGHDVLMCIVDEAKDARHVGDQLISKTRDFPAAVKWADVVVYDGNNFDLPREAELIRKTKPVVGSSAYGDMLEHDRLQALKLVAEAGLRVPTYKHFKDFNKARIFIERQTEDHGWVFKPNAEVPGFRTFVTYSLDEMRRMLDYAERRFEMEKCPVDFILEEKHDGVEVSTEAWFDGEDWCLPNGTLEKNRLMDHELGEQTGCSGNVVWLYRDLNAPLVDKLLEPMTPYLRGKYRGPVDINSIIDEATHEPIFLEFSTRFGYAAIFALTELVEDVGDLLYSIANGRPYLGPVLMDRFSIGVRASIPPYPCESDGIAMDFPVFGFDPDKFHRGIHPMEIRLDESGEAETTGPDGIVFEFTASAPTIEEARREVYRLINKIHVPNIRYRTDIGVDAERDFGILEQMKYVQRPQRPLPWMRKYAER